MGSESFAIEMRVRDYECDIQGIVNNSVYQNYLEHCRHEHLRDHNLDFAALSANNINLVVTRVEIDYLSPLRSGDDFIVTSHAKRISKIRYAFEQQIIDKKDQRPIVNAKVMWTAINERGRPIYTKEITPLFEQLAEI